MLGCSRRGVPLHPSERPRVAAAIRRSRVLHRLRASHLRPPRLSLDRATSVPHKGIGGAQGAVRQWVESPLWVRPITGVSQTEHVSAGEYPNFPAGNSVHEGMNDRALDRVTVASPCQADWNAMTGNEQVRFCELCKLNVYNLSGMTREKAESLVREREGKLCVRFYRRADGTMLTQDCPIRFRNIRRRLAFLACGLIAFLGAVVSVSALSRRDESGRRPIRDIEPFATVLEWLDPTPPPPISGPQTSQKIPMGTLCPAPPPPPTK